MHRIILLLALVLTPCLEKAGAFATKKYEITRMKGRGDQPVDFTLNDSAGHPVSLNQFRGKFVIICMEANWCRPCLNEVEPTKQLQQEFFGQDIVWLFISFDREKEDWDEARRADNLKGIHLWGKPKSEELKKIFNFDSLPYYVWVDPNGVIAVEDAPRPSARSAHKQLKLFVQR